MKHAQVVSMCIGQFRPRTDNYTIQFPHTSGAVTSRLASPLYQPIMKKLWYCGIVNGTTEGKRTHSVNTWVVVVSFFAVGTVITSYTHGTLRHLDSEMDHLRKLQCLCRSYKSHLTKLFSNIDKTLNKLPAEPLTNSNLASLEDYLKPLKQKATVFTDIDRNILDNLEEEEEFEATVLELEELQTMLSQKISLLMYQLAALCG